MTRQIHNNYGKRLLKEVVGDLLIATGPDTRVNYQGDISAKIDGVIEACCAIEIESRVAKQVRGALIDLLEHQLSKKLLILIPAHMNDPEATARHCKHLLEKYKQQGSTVKVVLLKGTGDNPKDSEDKKLIESALRELECLQNG